ncbi:MAG: hypothetical protein WD845_16250 [Pirellulales bacterium]
MDSTVKKSGDESRSMHDPPRWILLVLLCVAILVRGRVIESLSDGILFQDPDGYARVARLVVSKGVYASTTYNGRPVATAARAPLYPLLLAVAQFIGDTVTGRALFGLVHVALGVGTVFAVLRLARLWSLSPWASILAAALVTIDPIQLHYSAQIMTETLAGFLAAVTLVAITRFAQEVSYLRALLAGVLAGLCILCRPEFLAWTVGVVACFPFLAVGPRRLRRLSTYVVAAALVVAPWAIRNAREFGSPIITTTHGGVTLLLANNPSFYEYLRSAPWGSTWDGESINIDYAHLRSKHEYEQPALGTPMPWITRLAVDEVAVDREAYHLAFQNIRAEPGMFAYSCLVRVGRLWAVLPHATSPHESASRRGMRYAVGIFYTFELALALLGAWFVGRKLLSAPWVWGTLLLASYTAVHAFYWTDMRMRAPLVPVVALLVAVAVSQLAVRRRGATSLPDQA